MRHQVTIEERQKTFSHFQLVRVCLNEFLIHLEF